jgi:hypothetical protein
MDGRQIVTTYATGNVRGNYVIGASDETAPVNTESVGKWVAERTDDLALALAAIADGEAALERAVEIAEIVELRDKAQAVGIFYVAQHMGEAAQKAKLLQLRAERKAGVWLDENVGEGADVRWHAATGLPPGITKSQSSRWQLEAQLPESRFNEWADRCIAYSWELTSGGLRALAANHAAKHNGGEPAEASDIVTLKRIFRRNWPDPEMPDYARAKELIVELSGLIARRTG